MVNATRTVRFLLVFGILLLALPSSSNFSGHIPTAKAQPYINNIIRNSGFEQGLATDGYPLYWINWTKHGGPVCSTVPDCISLDTTRYVTGTTSAKLDLGQLDIGFISIAQSLPSSLTFRNLTNSPSGLDMWFYYLPKYGGSGDIRIRVLAPGEGVGELDYVFDPDPALGYPNSTNTATVYNSTCACFVELPAGVKNVFLYGYPEGQWHHIRLNLRSDWAAPLKITNSSGTFFVRGFSLDIPLPRIQFDALGFKSGGNYYSETVWIDEFKVCVDSQTPSASPCDAPPPSADHWINFAARDLDGNDITNIVKWKLFNNIDEEYPSYVLGDPTLPGNYTYTLKVYYPTDTGQTPEPYLVYQAILPLDSFRFIDLPMKPLSMASGDYVAFSNPVSFVTINQNTARQLNFTTSGNPGPSYTMIIDVARSPVLAVLNDLPTNFSYDPARSVITIRTDILGEFTVFFETPLQIPELNFTDLAQQPVQIGTVGVRILNSQGNLILYEPGKVLADDSYYLGVDYKGRQILRGPLTFGATSPVILPMIQLQTVVGGYVAFNTTATSTAKSETSSLINVTIVGQAPLLIIVDLPNKPLYVQHNGQRIVTWSYDEPSKTLEVRSVDDGTFTIVLQEKSDLPIYLISGAILAVILIVLGVVIWKRRVKSYTPTR